MKEAERHNLIIHSSAGVNCLHASKQASLSPVPTQKQATQIVQGNIKDCCKHVRRALKRCELGALLYTFQTFALIECKTEELQSWEQRQPCGCTCA